MWTWYMKALKQYVSPGGRAQRKEYWIFLLINTCVTLFLSLVTLVSSSGPDGSPQGLGAIAGGLQSLFSLAVFLPGFMVSIRRLHDVGKSGWWILLSFIPFIGWLILLFFFIKDSEPGTNQYGPNPKEEANVFTQA